MASLLRRSATRVAGSAPFHAAVRALERVSGDGAGRLPVLTYHRVLDGERANECPSGLVSADPAAFEAQVRYLAHHWRPVGLDAVLAARRTGTLPPRSLLVTFDDAYRDFADVAWPILRRHGVPAVLFVPTAYPGSDRRFWWDRVHHAVRAADGAVRWRGETIDLGDPPARTAAYGRIASEVKVLPHQQAMAAVDALVDDAGAGDPPASVLDWDDLVHLAREGVELAPHTRTHALLDRLAPELLADEIAGARDDLLQRTGASAPVLAYPDGHHDAASVAVTEAAGIEVAFTTRRGVNDVRRADWLRLTRINVGRRANVALLRAQLLPVAARLLERTG